MKRIEHSRQMGLAANLSRENHSSRGQVLKSVLQSSVRRLEKIHRTAAQYFERRRQQKMAFRQILALDSRTLRDIGLDRPRAIVFPNSL